MYQFYQQATGWPDLNMQPYLTFLKTRLDLDPKDLITLVLADGNFVQPLNKTYRDKDRSTNVLSFPSDADDELGDLIFALETIREEANEQSKSFQNHFQHLILHGSLHLLGYDHEIEKDAVEMETLEIKILEEFGLPNPYSV